MKEIETIILEYLRERKWDQLRPGDLAKSISIEAAELLEQFQWTNESLEEIKQNPERLEAIKSELADVLIYCLDMSVLLGFDAKETVLEKIEKIKEKYPAHLFENRGQDIDPGSEDIYWDIKKKHRANR